MHAEVSGRENDRQGCASVPLDWHRNRLESGAPIFRGCTVADQNEVIRRKQPGRWAEIGIRGSCLHSTLPIRMVASAEKPLSSVGRFQWYGLSTLGRFEDSGLASFLRQGLGTRQRSEEFFSPGCEFLSRRNSRVNRHVDLLEFRAGRWPGACGLPTSNGSLVNEIPSIPIQSTKDPQR